MEIGKSGIKELISAYFVTDLVLMLVKERRALEFRAVYFFFFFGGTLLDLLIINDFSFLGVTSSANKTNSSDFSDQFAASSTRTKDLLGMPHHSSSSYSSGHTSFGTAHFLDTCLTTILMCYRLFRLYSLIKQWSPNLKLAFKMVFSHHSHPPSSSSQDT